MINLRAGSNRTQVGGVVYKVSNFVIHPNYNRSSSEYDVALLNLTRPFNYQKTIKPIPLIKPLWNITIGELVYITGWGYVSTSSPAYSDNLRRLDLPIQDPSFCRYYYGKKFNPNTMLCTKDEIHKKGVCASSGYPLIAKGTLVGIYSTGYGCTSSPTLYTRLAALPIRSWIKYYTRI